MPPTRLTASDFRTPPVDTVALETRAQELATRSIKKASKIGDELLEHRVHGLIHGRGPFTIPNITALLTTPLYYQAVTVLGSTIAPSLHTGLVMSQ